VTAYAEDGAYTGSATYSQTTSNPDDESAAMPDPMGCGSDPLASSPGTVSTATADGPTGAVSPTTIECTTGSGWGGWKAYSGCRDFNAWVRAKSYLGATLFQYKQQMYYCFSNKRITSVSPANAWLSQNDGQSYLRGTAWTRYYYNYNSLGTSSGFKSQAVGTVERCWIKYGCVGVYYPRVTLYAHGDGTWYWSTTLA
jgi:hypothetical protein